MRVFNHYSFGKGTVIIQPANDVPSAECPAEWKSPKGEALMFTIKFKRGMADVSDNIGQYLIDRKLAFESALIPADAA